MHRARWLRCRSWYVHQRCLRSRDLRPLCFRTRSRLCCGFGQRRGCECGGACISEALCFIRVLKVDVCSPLDNLQGSNALQVVEDDLETSFCGVALNPQFCEYI